MFGAIGGFDGCCERLELVGSPQARNRRNVYVPQVAGDGVETLIAPLFFFKLGVASNFLEHRSNKFVFGFLEDFWVVEVCSNVR